MTRAWVLLVGLLAFVHAGTSAADEEGLQTWGYLVGRLTTDGVPAVRARGVFGDARVDPFDGLDFSLAPREPSALYRRHLSAASTDALRRCRYRHHAAFEAAARREGVSASVLAAIVQVESGCGAVIGGYRILPRLARLAMANEPANLQRNLERHLAENADEDPVAIERRVRARAQMLEDTFYPEVLATFTVADRLRWDPLALRGSGSGAFGVPQFLPTSYLRHGVDASGDGYVDLYDFDDAIASAARYLSANGWRPGLSVASRRQVLWTYNRSDAYIDTILALAARLEVPAARARIW